MTTYKNAVDKVVEVILEHPHVDECPLLSVSQLTRLKMGETEFLSFPYLCAVRDYLNFNVDIKGVTVSYLKVVGYDHRGNEVEIGLTPKLSALLQGQIKEMFS